jgi:hypothetical protein
MIILACGALAFVHRPDFVHQNFWWRKIIIIHFISRFILLPHHPATLVFDCLFRIAKGDVYTAGLKYNHTAIYRQKAAFYTKFIETSLEHGSFNVAKTEINDFGPGPDTIQLSFRVYLDMRRIQM